MARPRHPLRYLLNINAGPEMQRLVDTVLNACRSWHYLAGLGWTSKTAAATWAAQRWPGEVISAALAGRRREPGVVGLGPREVSDLLDHVRVLAESQTAAP